MFKNKIFKIKNYIYIYIFLIKIYLDKLKINKK